MLICLSEWEIKFFSYSSIMLDFPILLIHYLGHRPLPFPVADCVSGQCTICLIFHHIPLWCAIKMHINWKVINKALKEQPAWHIYTDQYPTRFWYIKLKSFNKCKIPQKHRENLLYVFLVYSKKNSIKHFDSFFENNAELLF